MSDLSALPPSIHDAGVPSGLDAISTHQQGSFQSDQSQETRIPPPVSVPDPTPSESSPAIVHDRPTDEYSDHEERPFKRARSVAYDVESAQRQSDAIHFPSTLVIEGNQERSPIQSPTLPTLLTDQSHHFDQAALQEQFTPQLGTDQLAGDPISDSFTLESEPPMDDPLSDAILTEDAVPSSAQPQPASWIPSSNVPSPHSAYPPSSTISPAQIKFALSTIRTLRRSKDAAPFIHPVDYVALNIPHYPAIIKKPMDFTTIEKKLIASKPGSAPITEGRYWSADEFITDVNLVFNNCYTFNGPQHLVSQMGQRVQEIFNKQVKQMPPPDDVKPQIVASKPPAVSHTSSTAHPNAIPKKPVTARRPSTSVPTARRNTLESNGSSHGNQDSLVASRPKREIHPPPPKDFAYTDGPLGTNKSKSSTISSAAASYSKKSGSKDDGTADQLKFCLRIINDMFKKQYASFAYFFYDPVDASIVPDYYKVIKKPMDLSTIKKKLEQKEYPDASKFYNDFQLLLKNCYTFNPQGTLVRNAGQQLQKLFEEKWSALPPLREPQPSDSEDSDLSDSDELIQMLRKQIASIEKDIEVLQQKKKKKKEEKERAKASAKKPRTSSFGASSSTPSSSTKANGVTSATPTPKSKTNGHTYNTSSTSAVNGKKKPSVPSTVGRRSSHAAPSSSHNVAVVASDDEDDEGEGDLDMAQKKELSESIEKLEGSKLEKVIGIIQDGVPGIGNNSEEIELEIDSLPSAVLHRLYNFVVKPMKAAAPPPVPMLNGRPMGKPKTGSGNTGRTGAAATGGIKRKSMDERVEAEKIRLMEEKARLLQAGGRLPPAATSNGLNGATNPASQPSQASGPGMGAGDDEEESVHSSDSSGSDSGSDSDSD